MDKIVQIKQLESQHFLAVIELANRVHGEKYLNYDALVQMQLQGIKNGINASFVALNSRHKVVGYRISFAPGQWQTDRWCSQNLWPVELATMAYFKSVAVSAAERGQGIGSRMLQASTVALKQQGAKAGLAHIWRQSPGNSAERYFTRAGGTILAIHPERWRHLSETIGYTCPMCDKLCQCSAAEMVLQF
ncbi:GNAT family N-acetyltransferase [Rheinheimera sp. MMS21-TC3]|uniref:GNAT family N-acetyltransferase n=1 Tax=Rheinheimera sp. MMS21-TC3 TaxID=3072790 RepID=UPI0028C43312|nr:GNAT family N-acetyltransferase [Rheinheimera sp. MMS21-TC3]WNO61110.1 GNAT family N-acetyltransferase [Rheinheimera sp. MMS21-TC3]